MVLMWVLNWEIVAQQILNFAVLSVVNNVTVAPYKRIHIKCCVTCIWIYHAIFEQCLQRVQPFNLLFLNKFATKTSFSIISFDL